MDTVVVSLLARADGGGVNHTRCVQACETVYFKHVYGGTVLAVIALCIVLLAVHCVALHAHERRGEE